MPVNGQEVASAAMQWIGTKYVWGGTGSSPGQGVDCSRLVQAILAGFGIKISRTTYTQINEGNKIAFQDLQVGDLVFFDTDRSTGGPDHVGMYIGSGEFIHAPRPGDSVKVSKINDGYYGKLFMGGRRPYGLEGGGYDSMDADTSGPAVPRLGPEELAAEYGWAYGFLNSNDELRGLFEQAVAGTWTSAQFQAKLRQTEWWKTNSASVRQAQMEAATDPATYAAKVQAASFMVRDTAAEMGAIIPEGLMSKIGEDFVRTGMSDEELRHSLGKYIDFTVEGTLAGQAGMAEIRLKQLAYANGVQIAPDSIKNYAQMIAMGVSTMEQAEQNVRNLATSMFPTYGEQIAAGINVQDIARPYSEMAARELELSPAEVGLDNQLVKQGINGLNRNGQPFGMTLNQYQAHLRSTPQWLKTNGARESIMKVGSDVLRSMGVVQ